jgi:hypothetical protein
MKKIFHNQKGFGIIYGLLILTIATVGGTAILYMAQKDRSTTTDYANIRSSSEAAKAALRAFEGQCATAPDTTLAILKKYEGNHSYKWLLGPSSASAGTEQTIKFWNATNAPRYSAGIVGFDSTNGYVVIEGNGYDGYGGKKKVVGAYQLEGMSLVSTSTTVNSSRYGLYLAKDGENFNFGMTINGDVYFGGTLSIQAQNAVPVRINGNLKTASVATAAGGIKSPLIVTGNAYFRCAVDVQNYADTIYGDAGFERNLSMAKDVVVKGNNAYSNASASGTGKIVMQSSSKTLLHSGSFPSANLSGGTPSSYGTTIPDIPDRLGMCPGVEGAVTIDLSSIPSGNRKSYATVLGSSSAALTAGPINTYYTNNPTQLWNGYLVIAIGASEWPQWSGTPGTLNCKVIWIIPAGKCLNPPGSTYWYNSSATSVSLIYLSPGAQLVPLWWSGTLRAIIYATGNATDQTQVQYYCNGQTLTGAIITTSTYASAFECSGPSGNVALTITYDDAIIDDFVAKGIATRTGSCVISGGGGGGGGSATALKLVDVKIRPTLIGFQM